MASSAKSGRAPIKRDSVGVSEKLRRHAGNIPVLPQTKQCPHCPAKFTRSTHLNRHLKTHSSERLHRCEACSSEFTRTDLLSRHKKTCNGVSRSRRKSCVPCAESKIKCDLAYPCDKCASRGKTCVLPGNVRPSSSRSLARDSPADVSPPETTALTHSTSLSDLRQAIDRDSSLTPPSDVYTNASSSSLTDWRTDSELRASTSSLTDWTSSAYEPSVAGSVVSADETGSIFSQSTTRSQVMPATLSSLYTSDVFGGLWNGLWTVPPTMEQPAPLSHARAENGVSYVAPVPITAAPPPPLPAAAPQAPSRASAAATATSGTAAANKAFYADLIWGVGARTSPSRSPAITAASGIQRQFSSSSSQYSDPPRAMSYSPPAEPTPMELDTYMQLFFTAFSPQMQIMHIPSWSPEGKPQILIDAMRACGALYDRSRRAATFIVATLAAARESLPHHFAKQYTHPSDQRHLMISVTLFQAVGLFHQKAETRASHNVFHRMLVQMIRQCNLPGQLAAWRPAPITDAASAELAWQDWAMYESAKRALLLSFVHDCCHVIYFGMPSLFHTPELTLSLPCDSALWDARNAIDWHQELQRPSPFGPATFRAVGYPMQQALLALSDTRKMDALTTETQLNTGAHWILIHLILRNLFALVPTSDPNRFWISWQDQAHPNQRFTRSASMGGDVLPDMTEDVVKVQYVMQNWLTIWLRSPEVVNWDWSEAHEMPFMQDALPFYWLGQVSLMALQEGMPPFTPESSRDVDARFRLVKHWLKHVREFLRTGPRQPTLLWNEMMKIRMEGVYDDPEGRPTEDQDGLLGFFPG